MLAIATSQLCMSQEWLTSLRAAKRVALVQDKFLFVMWENAALIPYPVIMNDANGNEIIFDSMFDNQEIDKIIWDYFVPVKVSEDLYAELYDQIKDTRSQSYIAQFQDDNIKIMDANFNIVNISWSPEAFFNLSEFIGAYALNTSFLKAELQNYSEQRNFGTAFRLGSKYMNYAILVNDKVRENMIKLANIYLDEADGYLMEADAENRTKYKNTSSLFRLSQYLIEDRPGKVIRSLKRFDTTEIDDTNESLISFLYYTAYQLRKDKKNAALWKNKVSSVNLKKAELIINLHR